MALNIKMLQTFYWAAELGSFAAAAERMNASQSTISMRILNLEDQLGSAVFDRSHRKVRLTPKGYELYDYVKRIVSLYAELEDAMSGAPLFSGRINIGVAEIVATTWLPRFMRTMHGKYPDLSINIDVDLGITVLRKMEAGAVDIAFGPGDLPIHNVNCYPLGSVDSVWVASPLMNLGGRSLAVDDLSLLPIISLSKDSSQQKVLDEWFRSNGASYKKVNTCNSLKVAIGLVVEGLGISVVPEVAVLRELDNGDLVRLDVSPEFPATPYFAYTEERHPRPILEIAAQVAQKTSDWER